MKTEYRNRLPHIAPIGATFFVTFRLGDSLPQKLIARLKLQMEAEISRLEKEKPANYEEAIMRQRKLFFKNYDHQLDQKPFGECYLKQPKVAQIVMDKLHEMDGDKYDLIAYCIMPNHVHLLVDFSAQMIDEDGFYLRQIPENYTQLHKVMQLIKGSTSYYANQLLGRKGKFWQKDSYDHYIRNEKEFRNIIRYILQNPVKAGLTAAWEDFPFTYLSKKYSGS
ncbi:MAG: hypothetical protein D6730_10990 [Bacteroidetes bacterium]|nr:MAG: hypothetical protein D6730_10990 [Bacteroidota bacterium]